VSIQANFDRLQPPPKASSIIYSDRLPTVKGEFFGRAEELALLDEAWKDKHTHILQFIAPGGTGKTKLLRYWLDHTENISMLLTWSFYSQGLSDNKQVSATPFFIHAFSKLGTTRTEFITEEDKGEHLADLIRERGGILVLDGLELSLLGNALRIRYAGDVRQRDNIKILTKAAGGKESRHAFRVMQAYEDWFAGEPELTLLYLLGLFDQPIGSDVMQVLWDANIPNLTADITEDDWLEAIDTLRNEHSLLFEHESDPELFDCHPLIREYFGKQLRDRQPDAWRQAHAVLYRHYQQLPDEEQPDTLEAMYPLFRTVEHGCLAGLHQQVFNKIYWKRISRGKHYFLAKKGAFGDDLSILIHFFQKPWEIPVDELDINSQALVLKTAGYRLRALGRIREAIQPFTAALKRYEQLNDPKEIAITSSSLIEPYLTLGNVKTALRNAERGVNHPDPKFVRRLENESIFARALHQSGRIKEALEHFIETEKLQHAYAPSYRYLYSLSGFRYSELLLAENRFEEVLERAHYALKIAEATTPNPLNIGLGRLMLGRVYLSQLQLEEASNWLESALTALREAGNQDHLPRGLLGSVDVLRAV
jgi:tetratricopeptide (TPR) repeat protein